MVQSPDAERVKSVLSQAEQIQGRLWAMAVTNARKDMNSDVAALYLESLTDVFAIHASRVAVGIQARIPEGIWLTLMAITILGMIGVGYQAGIAGSKRTLAMPLLAIAFALGDRHNRRARSPDRWVHCIPTTAGRSAFLNANDL